MAYERPRMLTTKEAARELRVTVRTVFKYIKQGTIKPVRIGGIKKAGKTLIPVSEIQKLLKERF